MATQELEQLLHGYRRGHEQLAGSVKLAARDSDLITRLSDLSGSLLGSPTFAPYLTAYPLPSGTYFALAKTWPDEDAGRAGCVLTHTLLVPMNAWATLPEPSILDPMLSLAPSRLSGAYDSAIPIPIPAGIHPKQGALGSSDQGDLVTFVHRYFGEGTRPVVWFGQRRPEDVLWRLLRGLWPRLRSTFSACTFCLQPRTLEDRAFELMFAPSAAYPRFARMKPEHFIDATANGTTDAQDDAAEPWCYAWSKRLFGPVPSRWPPGEGDLWTELDEDPTAVRRFFLVEGLMEDGSPTPQMLVGAMDLVESLAKDRDSAVASKRRVAQRAVRAAREVDDPGSSLESLRLIEDRLRRTSFSGVQEEVGRAVVEAVAGRTKTSPELTVQLIGQRSVGADLRDSWFGRGLLQGFIRLGREEPAKLLCLWSVPSFAREILTAEPTMAAGLMPLVALNRREPSARSELLRWLIGVQDDDLRSALRATLVPILDSADLDILAELLKDVRTDEVGGMLDALWRQTGGFEPGDVGELVKWQLARSQPSPTREWTRQLPDWTPVVAKVFAATYPPTRQGLLELLDNDGALDTKQQAEAVAAFIQGLGSGRYPNWLRDAAREDAMLVSALLQVSPSPSAVVAEQTQKLLKEVPALPVAHLVPLLQQVLGSSKTPFFQALLDWTMRSLIPGVVAGSISEAVSGPFQDAPVIAPWFSAVDPWQLRSLVVHERWPSTLHWINAWRWTARAPGALYAREPAVLSELIDALSRSKHAEWSSEVSDAWVQVLQRSRSESPRIGTRLVLCVQALKFCFENTRLPLGSVVAEVFSDVYAAVTESSMLPPEVAPLFGIFDWDKGKELRRELVDSFLRSTWPPGDLFQAVDTRLLRKVFKRLTKTHRGERYAHDALSDLEGRRDQSAAALAVQLRDMLATPDFFEEWD